MEKVKGHQEYIEGINLDADDIMKIINDGYELNEVRGISKEVFLLRFTKPMFVDAWINVKTGKW